MFGARNSAGRNCQWPDYRSHFIITDGWRAIFIRYATVPVVVASRNGSGRWVAIKQRQMNIALISASGKQRGTGCSTLPGTHTHHNVSVHRTPIMSNGAIIMIGTKTKQKNIIRCTLELMLAAHTQHTAHTCSQHAYTNLLILKWPNMRRCERAVVCNKMNANIQT